MSNFKFDLHIFFKKVLEGVISPKICNFLKNNFLETFLNPKQFAEFSYGDLVTNFKFWKI